MLIYRRYCKARRDLRSLVRKVSRGETVIIVRADDPAAVMMPVDAYRQALARRAIPPSVPVNPDESDAAVQASFGRVSLEAFMVELGMSREDLAQWLNVDVATISSEPSEPSLQTFLTDCLKVIAMMQLVGELPRADAVHWFRDAPLEVFRGHTALELVAQGRAEAIMEYLDSISSGFVG